MSKIRVLIKNPGEDFREEMIEDRYETYRNLVGGYIEYCFSDIIDEGLSIIINEEGKLLNLPHNFSVRDYSENIVGPAIFVRTRGSKNVDLEDEDIKKIKKWLAKQNKLKNTAFARWLDTFLEEKGVDRTEFVVLKKSETPEDWTTVHVMQIENIVMMIKEMPLSVQTEVKKILVELDVLNAPIEKIKEFLIFIAKMELGFDIFE